jgi:hypothetical protein
MVELKASLDGTSTLKEVNIDPKMGYMVDFTRLTNVNDLVVILSAMGISFPGNHPLIQHLTPFLNLESPFPLEQPKNTELPTLKKV